MRKIIIILLGLFLLVLPAFADDESGGNNIEDAYKYTQGVENGFVGQKMITDEQFQKALSEVKAKQKKGKKKNALKGNSFNEESSGDYIHETKDNVTLLTLPVELQNNDGADIPIGLYKIVGEKNDNGVYLDFYQSSECVAKVPALETNSDFGEPDINFVKLIPYDNNRVKIIYGSMDFNAYTFVRINK